ncbi:hypothetical protein [Sutcliffiella horikoshii]|uniref:hypothetical protein n=1 Tax=Sutcliffiella horikoshii TaxID=79883 RepID=UPI003CEC0782
MFGAISVIQQAALDAKDGKEGAYDKLEQLFKGRFMQMERRYKHLVSDEELLQKQCAALLKKSLKELKEFDKKCDFASLYVENVENYNWSSLSYDEFSAIYDDPSKTLDEVVQELKMIPNRPDSQSVKVKDMSKQDREKLKEPIKENDLLPKNFNEEQCMLAYCALPFEKRLSELRIIVKKISEKDIIKILKKFKKQGFVTYGVGWNAERKAILTSKGTMALEQLQKTP